MKPQNSMDSNHTVIPTKSEEVPTVNHSTSLSGSAARQTIDSGSMPIKSIDNRKRPYILGLLWRKPVRLFLCGIVSHIVALGISYAVYRVMDSNTDHSRAYAGLLYVVIAICVYLALIPITAILALKLFRVPHWFRIGLFTSLSVVTPELVLRSAFTFQYIAFPVAISGIAMSLIYCLDARSKSRTVSIILMVSAAIAINGLCYAGVSVLATQQANNYRRSDLKKLNQAFSSLSFSIFLPDYLPSGYVIDKITAADKSDVDILHVPAGLTVDVSDKEGGQVMTINEFSLPKSFNPPTDCGPYQAETLSVGPISYPLSCNQVSEVNGIKIYYESAESSSGAYNYYFVKGSTEITISDSGSKLTEPQLQSLVSGLRQTSSDKLPQQLLQQY